MKKLIFFLIPLILLGCGESEERDILWDVTGVWSNSNTIDARVYGPTVFEINFYDTIKTLKFTFTSNSSYRNGEDDINDLYDVSIKNIDKENKILSFYLTKKGENFKKPMRENPIWTIRQYFSRWNDSFNISLTTHKGDIYDLGYVRDY